MEREVPLPSWFLDEPPQIPFGDFFLRHFWILDTERPLGWTHGRIPQSKVIEYAYRLGLPADMIDLFAHVILAVDRAYLGWISDQREKAQPPKKVK